MLGSTPPRKNTNGFFLSWFAILPLVLMGTRSEDAFGNSSVVGTNPPTGFPTHRPSVSNDAVDVELLASTGVEFTTKETVSSTRTYSVTMGALTSFLDETHPSMTTASSASLRNSTSGDGSNPGSLDVLKCCPGGKMALFHSESSLIDCIPHDPEETEKASTSWSGEVVEFDINGLMHMLQPQPKIASSSGSPVCRAAKSVLYAYPWSNAPSDFVLFSDGRLGLVIGGYVPRGQFCLDNFVVPVENSTKSSGEEVPAEMNVGRDQSDRGKAGGSRELHKWTRGAVFCAESIWRQPAVKVDVGAKGTVVLPKCCPREQVLNSDLVCVSVSAVSILRALLDGSNAFPVRTVDGEHANTTSVADPGSAVSRKRLRVEILDNVLSRLRTSCLSGEPVLVNPRAEASGNVDFHFLETGHLFLPVPDKLFQPSTFCLERMERGRDAGDKNMVFDDVALLCPEGEDRSDNDHLAQPTKELEPALLRELWRNNEMACNERRRTGQGTVCVIKCCPPGQRLGLGDSLSVQCVPTPVNETVWSPVFHQSGTLRQVHVNKTDVRVLSMRPICEESRHMPLIPDQSTEQATFLLDSGRVYSRKYDMELVAPGYCMDHLMLVDFGVSDGNGTHEDPSYVLTNVTLTCYPEDESQSWVHMVNVVCLIVSSVFLALTLLANILLPYKNRLNNLTLLTFVAALLVGTLLLVANFYARDGIVGDTCIAFAVAQLFAIHSAFAWLNVMSFDIWYSSFYWYTRRHLPTTRSKMIKKYLRRCVYGFGAPLGIVGVVLILQFLPGIPTSFATKPIDPSKRCWFWNDSAIWLFLYGPIALLLASNLVFFFLTAHFLIKHQQSTRDLNMHKNEKPILLLFAKLFVVMGVGWIAEIVSWRVGPSEMWLVTDIVNGLTGVFIFIMSVCSRRTVDEFQRRFCPSLSASHGQRQQGCCGGRFCRLVRRVMRHPSRLVAATRDLTNRLGGRAKEFSLTPSADGAGMPRNASGSGINSSSSAISRNRTTKESWIPNVPESGILCGNNVAALANLNVRASEDSLSNDGMVTVGKSSPCEDSTRSGGSASVNLAGTPSERSSSIQLQTFRAELKSS